MKRFVIIGLGTFGSTVATRLYLLRHEVIAIDRSESVVDRLGPHVTRAVVAEGTSREALEEIGARGADAAVISTGDDLAASVLALMSVRDLGIKEVYVKVTSSAHARIVDALGATETIFPEREVAEGLASRITSSKLLRYVQYSNEFGIQEMAVPDEWQGRTLEDLDLPGRYPIQVVAIHDMLTDSIATSRGDRPLTASDTLLVAGPPAALEKLERLR